MTVLGLETVLRFMPVSDGLRGGLVSADNPIYRFEPNRLVRWSKGWNFSLVNELRTNNYGFISNLDYDPSGTFPLLSVIGDSFVEAALVPYGKTIAGLLNTSVNGRGRVYSFGASGAALSQYLAYASYAAHEFNPAGMIIVIVGNDFDESLMKYRRYPGFHYFAETAEGDLQLTRLDRSVPLWKDLLVSSAVGRYLVMNLEAGNVVERLEHKIALYFGSDQPFIGNVKAEVETARLIDSRRAVDAFLALLPSMSRLAPRRIALVVDAPRPEIYFPNRLHAAQKSFFGEMRRYLIDQAFAKGFEIIDLEKIFVQDYQERGMPFEHRNDYHWNATGHEVVAEAVRRSSVYHEVFASTNRQ
jgi:hypothetical protein